ncbi:MAG: hypothetical protein MI754_12800 [Chromatiales bacterium]|nr:hypothetical protein [Chromatiales bacterium]
MEKIKRFLAAAMIAGTAAMAPLSADAWWGWGGPWSGPWGGPWGGAPYYGYPGGWGYPAYGYGYPYYGYRYPYYGYAYQAAPAAQTSTATE